MTVYFISGLGADERVFDKLTLPLNWDVQHIAWLPHLPNESLSSYCHRLSAAIDTPEFVLVGLSFGGIVAVELAHFLNPKLTVLISSVATRRELPLLYRMIAKTKLDRLVPASFLKIPNSFLYRFFGTSAAEEKRLLRQTIANTNSRFLKWAIHEIINWTNSERPAPLFHIHGTNDHLFAIKNTNADVQIQGGGHLLVYDSADEISRILTEVITSA